MIDLIFSELTIWHWIGLALMLLVFEMMLGTFDLLWIAIAAGAAAVFASVMPEPFAHWTWQVGFFALVSFGLVVLGRTVFAGIRNPPTSHPTLNDRGSSMIGQKAVVTSLFQGGFGRVKINDSEWRAELEGDVEPIIGAIVEIVSTSGITVRVRPA